jgi:hypothetical protein
MKLSELVYVGVLVALALLFNENCGGTVDEPLPPIDTRAPETPKPEASSRVCYSPANPMLAYACGTDADCSSCPASCTVPNVGEGECKP